MAGRPGADVADCLVEAVHHGNRKVEVHVFGGPVLVGGRFRLDGGRKCGAGALIGVQPDAGLAQGGRHGRKHA